MAGAFAPTVAAATSAPNGEWRDFVEALGRANFFDAETPEEMLDALSRVDVGPQDWPEEARTLQRLLRLYESTVELGPVLEDGDLRAARASLERLRLGVAREPVLQPGAVVERLEEAIVTLDEAPDPLFETTKLLMATDYVPRRSYTPASIPADAPDATDDAHVLLAFLRERFNGSSTLLADLHEAETSLAKAREDADAARAAEAALARAGLEDLSVQASEAAAQREARVDEWVVEVALAVSALSTEVTKLSGEIDERLTTQQAAVTSIEATLTESHAMLEAALAAHNLTLAAGLEDIAALAQVRVLSLQNETDNLTDALASVQDTLNRTLDEERFVREAADMALEGRIDDLVAALGDKAWDAVVRRDGAGSGLDADTLDGLDSLDFVRLDEGANVTVNGTVAAARFVGDGSGLTGVYAGDADTLDGFHSTYFAAAGALAVIAGRLDGLNNLSAQGAFDAVLARDGAGSGLGADTLDGLDSTFFAAAGALADVAGRLDGLNNLSAQGAFDAVLARDGAGSGLAADTLDGLDSTQFAGAGALADVSGRVDGLNNLSAQGAFEAVLARDGAGSGLDADTLDGLGSVDFVRLDNGADATVVGTVAAARFVGDGSGLTGIAVSDADTLDGLDASKFVRTDVPDTIVGPLDVTSQVRIDGQLVLKDNRGVNHNFERPKDGPGIVFRAGSNPSPGEPILSVRSEGHSDRLVVEHDGVLRTTNPEIYTSAARNSQGVLTGHKVWHAGNDGAGSGLVADRLDGFDSAASAAVADGNLFSHGGAAGFQWEGRELRLAGNGGGMGLNGERGRALADAGPGGLFLNAHNDFGRVKVFGPTQLTDDLQVDGAIAVDGELRVEGSARFIDDVVAQGNLSVGSWGLNFYDGTRQTSGVMVGEVSGGGAKLFADPRFEVSRFTVPTEKFVSLLIAIYGGDAEALVNEGAGASAALGALMPPPIQAFLQEIEAALMAALEFIVEVVDFIIKQLVYGINLTIGLLNDLIAECFFCPEDWNIAPLPIPVFFLPNLGILDLVAMLAFDLVATAIDAAYGDPVFDNLKVYIPGLYRVKFSDGTNATWSMVESNVPGVDATSLSNSLFEVLDIRDENDESVEPTDLVVFTSRAALGVPMPFPAGFKFVRTAFSYPFEAKFHDFIVSPLRASVSYPDPTGVVEKVEYKLNTGSWAPMTETGHDRWSVQAEFLSGDTIKFRAYIAGNSAQFESVVYDVDLPFDPEIGEVTYREFPYSERKLLVEVGAGAPVRRVQAFRDGLQPIEMQKVGTGRSKTVWEATGFSPIDSHVVFNVYPYGSGVPAILDNEFVSYGVPYGQTETLVPSVPFVEEAVEVTFRQSSSSSSHYVAVETPPGVALYSLRATLPDGSSRYLTGGNPHLLLNLAPGSLPTGSTISFNAVGIDGQALAFGPYVVTTTSEETVLPKAIVPTYTMRHESATPWWSNSALNGVVANIVDPATGISAHRVEYGPEGSRQDMTRVGEGWYGAQAKGTTMQIRAWFGPQFIDSTWNIGTNGVVSQI